VTTALAADATQRHVTSAIRAAASGATHGRLRACRSTRRERVWVAAVSSTRASSATRVRTL